MNKLMNKRKKINEQRNVKICIDLWRAAQIKFVLTKMYRFMPVFIYTYVILVLHTKKTNSEKSPV